MDDVDVIIAGLERELQELRSEIRALGERLAAGENAVRAELNPAIRREEQLLSDSLELKRAYQRLTPMDEYFSCGGVPSTAPAADGPRPRRPQAIPRRVSPGAGRHGNERVAGTVGAHRRRR